MLGQRECHEDWLERGRDVGPQRRSPVRITLLTKRSAAPRTCGTWISSTPPDLGQVLRVRQPLAQHLRDGGLQQRARREAWLWHRALYWRLRRHLSTGSLHLSAFLS